MYLELKLTSTDLAFCLARYSVLILLLLSNGKAREDPDPFVSQLILKSEMTQSDILTVLWQIQFEECGWRVSIVTANYTLHPNQFPQYVPIEKEKEYNVSFIKNSPACVHGEGRVYEINVTLSITLNENVLKNAPYVVCLLSRRRIDGVSQIHRSKEVRLQTYMSVHVTTSIETDPQSTPSIDTTTSTNLTTSGAVWHTAGQPLQRKVLCLFTFLIPSFLHSLM